MLAPAQAGLSVRERMPIWAICMASGPHNVKHDCFEAFPGWPYVLFGSMQLGHAVALEGYARLTFLGLLRGVCAYHEVAVLTLRHFWDGRMSVCGHSARASSSIGMHQSKHSTYTLLALFCTCSSRCSACFSAQQLPCFTRHRDKLRVTR